MGRKTKVPYNHEATRSLEATGVDVKKLFEDKFNTFMNERIEVQGKTGTKMSVESEALEQTFTKRELCILLTRELSRPSRQDPFQAFLTSLGQRG